MTVLVVTELEYELLILLTDLFRCGDRGSILKFVPWEFVVEELQPGGVDAGQSGELVENWRIDNGGGELFTPPTLCRFLECKRPLVCRDCDCRRRFSRFEITARLLCRGR